MFDFYFKGVCSFIGIDKVGKNQYDRRRGGGSGS